MARDPGSLVACANGGRVAYNTLINNNQSAGFAGVCGGRYDHNYVPTVLARASSWAAYLKEAATRRGCSSRTGL